MTRAERQEPSGPPNRYPIDIENWYILFIAIYFGTSPDNAARLYYNPSHKRPGRRPGDPAEALGRRKQYAKSKYMRKKQARLGIAT
jgi:hypothetical protein